MELKDSQSLETSKKQIAREREDAVYRQIEMREQMMYGILILLLIGLLVPLIALIIS